uniref:BAG family molecular chaperone regulator 1-like n=1 Tax=Erigeron canadensis TaxID=72917 RepID=UPI001CB98ABE|nr:BAG family molecular chaperone regulator 1-like [Erigeron canadensis]
MMRVRTRATEMTSTDGNSGAGAGAGAGGVDIWEVRPGGMLVQKRDPDAETHRIPPPTIRVRVKHGSIYHEININSQATFGELKKMLTGPTGLHHEDQKLMYKDKARDSKSYLDVAGVKDRSKMVVMEDPISQEKRLVEMRKNAKMEKAAKSISDVSFEVDRLAGQVSAIESVISKGGKVAEKTLLTVTELLMNQLLKLDGITVDGDVKLQRKAQVKRIQEYVEILDALKIKNSTMSSNVGTAPQSKRTVMADKRQPPSSGAMTTTEWEIFESMAAPPPATTSKTMHPMFNWDLI